MKRYRCVLMMLMVVFLCAACGAEEWESKTKTISTEIGGIFLLSAIL